MGVKASKQRHKPRISKLQIPWLLRGAIRSNNVETLQYLFSYPNKVDPSMVIDGVCPLNLAVELGHLQMVKILIKAGADIHVADAPRYPLHQASLSGRAAVAELLIRSGASISVLTERRQSCVHLLSHQSAARFVETVHVLMRHNANPNTLDDDGLAPLHRASVEMVHALASYEVTDLNVCSREGDTPLLTAVKDRRESVLLALLRADQQYREQQQQCDEQHQKPQKFVCRTESSAGDETTEPLQCATFRTASAKSYNSTTTTTTTTSRLTLVSAASAVFRAVSGHDRGVVRASSAASVALHSVNRRKPQLDLRIAPAPQERGQQQQHLALVKPVLNGEIDGPVDDILDSGPRLPTSCLSRLNAKPSKIQSPEQMSTSHRSVVASSFGGGMSNLVSTGLAKSENCKRCHSVGNPSDISGWLQSCDRLQRLLLGKATSTRASHLFASVTARPAVMSIPNRPPPAPVQPRLDLDRPDKIGMTTLMIAAEAGNSGLNMTVALVHAGSNVGATDKVGMNALHHACYVGALNVVRFLLERIQPGGCFGGGGSNSAMAHCGSTVKLSGSPHLCTVAGMYSGPPGSHVVIPALLDAQDKYGRTPIYLAACRGHTEVVNYLLACSADFHIPNKEHKSPLYISAYFGYLDIVNTLLRHGAQVDQTDSHRKTPLYVAVYHGRSDIVDLLLTAGANVNAADKNGKTPLYIAVLHGHSALAQKLLNAGASVNRVDREGLGPLHMAVKFPKLDIPMVKLLLSYGCDPVNLASFTRWLLVHGIIPQECIHGDDELARWLHWEECNVRSLKRICRVAIQRALGNTDSMRVKLRRLPLPEHLLSYVSMKEL